MNCLQLTLGMNFVVTHIYRDGNQCVDTLASIGFNVDCLLFGLFCLNVLAMRMYRID